MVEEGAHVNDACPGREREEGLHLSRLQVWSEGPSRGHIMIHNANYYLDLQKKAQEVGLIYHLFGTSGH